MASSTRFEHLFTPLEIGSVTVKNRLVTAAHSHDFWKFDPERYHRWNKFKERRTQA
jgi:2,4-dienoyl-CoA reductase-like NADH-dependent reductase (Old Yellow Enzyme family)